MRFVRSSKTVLWGLTSNLEFIDRALELLLDKYESSPSE